MSAGTRPRVDYREIADRLGADLLDHPRAVDRLGRFGRLVSRALGANITMALALVARSDGTILTDGEQVGLPYAAISRLRRHRPAHYMVVHVMSVAKKTVLFRALLLRKRIDGFVVYSSHQAARLRALGVADDAIHLTPFTVDTAFFDPSAVPGAAGRRGRRDRPTICSAGLEYRDYATLVAAVRGLDVEVVIAAASPWSKRTSGLEESALPANVAVASFSMPELRRLYADSAIVVVPLHDVEFQAGVTTILEAMAMGKAVICTATRGQTDVIVDGETGVYVPPADPTALRAAIGELLGDPDRADRLGAAARRWVVEVADIERYADRLARIVAAGRR